MAKTSKNGIVGQAPSLLGDVRARLARKTKSHIFRELKCYEIYCCGEVRYEEH